MTHHPNPPRAAIAASLVRRASGLARRLVHSLQGHVWLVATAIVVLAALAVPFAANRTGADEPDFDPAGEIYEVMDLVDERFNTSDTVAVQFVVEGRAGDALHRAVLLEWLENTERVLANDETDVHLTSGHVAGVDGIVDGIWSIAQVVDDELPAGLAGSTDGEVAAAVTKVLEDDGIQRTLAQTASERDGTWTAPAFMATLLVDNGSFPDDVDARRESGESAAYLGIEAQEWVREVQEVLQGDELSYRAIGAGFDGGLAFTEQLGTAAPFILLAIVVIVLLVGVLLRSYWAAVLVILSLSCILLLYGGALDLLGFDGGMLLGFIVPIAGIAFGVDFFIHAVERIREAGGDADEVDPRRAAGTGLIAIAPALIVALASSVAAFLANTVSGVEAIVQFGFGAAILLVVSFCVLGFVAPAVLARIEPSFDRPARLSVARRAARAAGLVAVAVLGGVVVTMALVVPPVGAIGMVVVAALLVGVPCFRSHRRRSLDAGGHTSPVAPHEPGRAAVAVGRLVAGVARTRAIVLPLVIGLAVIGLVGFIRIESNFSFSDFYSEDSEFIAGLDLLDEHFGTTTGAGEGLVYLEGDLADPAVLRAIDRIPATIAQREAESGTDFLARDLDDRPIVAPNLASVVRGATGSTVAREAVLAGSGVEVTDADGDGLADTAAQVRAIVDLATVQGVDGDDGRPLYTGDSVRTAVFTDGQTMATTVRIGINSLTDDSVVTPARALLEDAADEVRAAHPDHLDRVSASGDTIVRRDSLNSFTDAMRLAVPIAFAACVLLVTMVLRSLRDALVTVGPSLLVVVWIYGLMHVAGSSVNVVTATIAAIAIGVGLDYSTHFTMRYREELRAAPSRINAVRRAGTDTGGPLAISALSSIVGFGVMALAPMPIFATFGLLTAVMVLLSLVVSLFVLPSLLVLAGSGHEPAAEAAPAPRATAPPAGSITSDVPAFEPPLVAVPLAKEAADA